MAITALQAARTKLKADAALSAYFVSRYGRDAKHILGYKRPNNANDFPAICYQPAISNRPAEIGGMGKERVSIVIAINEPGISDDGMDGPVICAEIEALIFTCLETGSLGANAMYLGEDRTTTDLGTRHPFYEFEISCLLAAR